MSQDPRQLVNEALKLPVVERGQLAAQLIQSLDSSIDDDAAEAWSAEISQRLDDIDQSQVRMVPWPEARALIRGQGGIAAD